MNYTKAQQSWRKNMKAVAKKVTVMKTIVVEAAASQVSLEVDGCVVDARCDTIKEAKALARRFVSMDYAREAEAELLGYARVLVNGENVFDVFGSES